MPQPILIPLTELKKEYNFLWYVGLDKVLTPGIPLKVLAKFRLLMNHTLTTYISQMAEKVSLPDDSIDTEDYNIGSVQVPVPKRIPMPDIRVTYLEDSNDTVYNFHKSWMSFVREGDTFSMEPLYPYSIIARYITFDNTLTSAEHSTLLKAQSNLSASVKNSNIYQMLTTADMFAKPKSIYNYPHIFPTGISRGEANKGGNGLSKITVTYKRLPEITKSKNYINMANKDFFVQSTNTRTSSGGLGEAISNINQLFNNNF